MHKTILKYLLFSLLAIMLASIIAVIYISTMDVNDYRSYFEKIFEKSTGLQMQIEGEISFAIEENMSIKIGKVYVKDQAGLLFQFDSVQFETDFAWPKDTFRLYNASIFQPIYHFRTEGVQPMNTESSSGSIALDIDYIEISAMEVYNGLFTLSSNSDSAFINVKDIESKDVQLSIDLNKEILDGLFISATTMQTKADIFNIKNEVLDAAFTMGNGLIKIENHFPSKKEDDIIFSMDLKPESANYSINGRIRNEQIVELYQLHDIDLPDFIKGNFNADFDINFSLPDGILVAENFRIQLSIESSNSIIKGVNLDKLIKSYRRTQNFSMKDLGSVMLLGPVGLAISKGGDYTQLAISNSKDSSLIEFLYADISLDSGIIALNDVGFRTSKNRIALTGNIDIINLMYDRFAYLLLKNDGCPEIREEFNGPFEHNAGKDGGTVKFVLGPVTNLFKGSSKIILNENCQYPYNGKVEAPTKKSLLQGTKKGNKKEEKSLKKEEKKEKKLAKKKST